MAIFTVLGATVPAVQTLARELGAADIPHGPSASALGGWAVRPVFADLAPASTLARLMAARLGVDIRVRRVQGRWQVSVPAAPVGGRG